MVGGVLAHAAIGTGDEYCAVDRLIFTSGPAVPPNDMKGKEHLESRGNLEGANVGELEERHPEGDLDEDGAQP